MNIFNLFVILLFTVNFVLCSLEIEFLDLEKEIIIGEKDHLQVYTNNFEEDGDIDITLILDNGKKYELKSVICHHTKGRFSWDIPKDIPDRTYGHFYYKVSVSHETLTGETGKMKFVYASSSSSSSSSSTSSSSSRSSSSYSTTTTTTSPTSYSSNPIGESNPTGYTEDIISVTDESNNLAFEEIPTDSTKNSGNENENGKYYLIIGGGGGIFVLAIAGILIFTKSRSKRSLSNYAMKHSNPFSITKPYKNLDYSKMAMKYPDMPSLLDSNLSPVSINNSPSINGSTSPLNSTMNNGYLINSPKSYRVQNVETASVPSSFSNSPKNKFDDNFINNYNSNNHNIVNLNSDPTTDLNIDVRPAMISKTDFFVTPRFGSLTRRKGPNDVNTSLLLNDEENYKGDYSMLSIMSANNSYSAFQAEHTVNHFLLNKVCTVAYVIEPENDDELFLNIGDRVKILEVYDDGWAYSKHLKSGLEGMIPLNCTSEFYQ